MAFSRVAEATLNWYDGLTALTSGFSFFHESTKHAAYAADRSQKPLHLQSCRAAAHKTPMIMSSLVPADSLVGYGTKNVVGGIVVGK